MVGKVLLVTMAAIGLMAVTGIGFASFVATGTASVTGTAGTLTFTYSAVSVTSSSQQGGYAGDMLGCTSAPTPTSNINGGQDLTVSVTQMSPGDWCSLNFEITNTGNIPGTYKVMPGTPPSSTCWQWIPSGTITGTLAAGASSSQVSIALELTDEHGGAGNSCEGETGTISASISLTSLLIGEGGEPSPSL